MCHRLADVQHKIVRYGIAWAAQMLKIMAIALAAARTCTVSLLLGIFIVKCKLYFFQIESKGIFMLAGIQRPSGFFMEMPPIVKISNPFLSTL
jgi:hypothetical protein